MSTPQEPFGQQPDFGPPQQPQYGPPGYGQPQYGPPPFPGPGMQRDPSAPYGRHPITGQPYSDKQKLVAGLLQILVGTVGAGRWYLGNYGMATAQLLTCGGLGIWAIVDGILIFLDKVPDKEGRPLRD